MSKDYRLSTIKVFNRFVSGRIAIDILDIKRIIELANGGAGLVMDTDMIIEVNEAFDKVVALWENVK